MRKINIIILISFVLGLGSFIFGIVQINFIYIDNEIIYDEFCFNSGFDKSTSDIMQFNETLNYVYCTKKVVDTSDNLIINISTLKSKVIYVDEKIIPSGSLFFITIFSGILLIISLVIIFYREMD